MDNTSSITNTFRDMVWALYGQLGLYDQPTALESLKDLVKQCERKLPNTDESICDKEHKIARLEVEIKELKEENEKLKYELEKLSPVITKSIAGKRVRKDIQSSEEFINSIINDILLRVVPPVRRKVGRPRKEPKAVDDIVPFAEIVPRRKPGRPRKCPVPNDSVFDSSSNVQSSKRKYTELENDQVEECLDEKKQYPVVIKKEHDEAETVKLDLSPRLRKRKNVIKAAFSDEDEYQPLVSFAVDNDSDVDLLTLCQNKSPNLMVYNSKLNGIPQLRKRRGRPRKHPIRDPNTIKKHKTIVRHVCQICNAQFLHGRPFHRHLSVRHDAGATSCLRCKQEFENYAHYLHHKCEAQSNRHKRACKRCESTFSSVKKLQHHMQTVHGMKTIDPIYFCRYCKKGFIRKISLMRHLHLHANGQHVCDKCGIFSTTDEDHALHMNTHRQQSTGNSLHCERCGAVFDRKQQFDQHVAAHDKYDCTICDQVFSRKKNLLKHVRDGHGLKVSLEEKKHTCNECGRLFNRPGQLQIHLRVHTGERPIECSTCKIFFKTTKALWKHRQTHTHMQREGAIPLGKDHLCSICGKAYFRKQALQRHMRYHDERKPFNCPHCTYQCRDGNNLKRHILLHFSTRQFVCEICGSAFHAKKTLETHYMYKHSSDRQYKCPDCPMAFKTPNSLRRHKFIHATVRPYKCLSCNMGFNRLYNLRRHMKRVHGNDDNLPQVNKVKIVDVPQGTDLVRQAMEEMFADKKVISQEEFFSSKQEAKDLLRLKQQVEVGTLPTLPGHVPHIHHPGTNRATLPQTGTVLALTTTETTSSSQLPPLLTIPQILGHQPTPLNIYHLPTTYALADDGSAEIGLQTQRSSAISTQSLGLVSPLSLVSPLHIPPPYLSASQSSRITSYTNLTVNSLPTVIASTSTHSHDQQVETQASQLSHDLQQPQLQRHSSQQVKHEQASDQIPVVNIPLPNSTSELRITYPPDMFSPVGNILHLLNNSS